jgi:hypothetical protein
LEHFAANLGFWGALAWCADRPLRLGGLLLTLVFAVGAIRNGLRSAREIFVVYGVAYAAMALCVVAAGLIQNSVALIVVQLAAVLAAAAALWRLHARRPGPA